ncbi:hypothetical protein [Cellulosimicrobium sp. E-16]|uniref:hypothetical protein n=1 Tax=Cellulosimicrobium sp. E-16 TaxID=3404049 RepID=UPI003CF3F2A8
MHDDVAPRRSWYAAVAVAVLLATGLGVAAGLGDVLAVEAAPAFAAPEDPAAAPRTPVAEVPPVSVVALPDDSLRLSLAADALVAALAGRGRDAEARAGAGGAGEGGTRAPAGELRVVTGTDLGSDDPEAYRVTVVADGWLLEAADPAGAAHGLYEVADRVRTGRAALPAGAGDPQDGAVREPALGMRLVDKGATGIEPDAQGWREGDPYSHNGGSFADAILSEAPYVDDAALADDAADLRGYVASQLAQGFTGVVVPGFLEYVTFDGVGDGHDVYPVGDEHLDRALAMREGFGPLWADTDEAGMDVYLQTDMLMLSTPLRDYLDGRGLDVHDPALWDVYAAGLDELFTAMPAVDGIMVRIGEAGRIYDLPGWDYWSELAVTDEEAVRAMLGAFTRVAEEHGKDVIFRSWSVGVGAVGDLHTNPESYESVLAGIDSPSLVVSTKHVAGDFYSWLPLNPTLEVGTQRRIVELQSRREFEGFGALPNDLAPAYAAALDHYLAANPGVEGVWAWAQDGGPWKAGPMSLYRKSGFWQLYDLNTYAAARLAVDPGADPGEITASWARATFSDDPATVAAVGEAMARSRDAVRQGLYIEPFAENRVRALGLEPPPMMWIFEWDIVSGDAAALDSISSIVGTDPEDVEAAVAEGRRAVETVAEMRALVGSTDPATWRDEGLRTQLLDAIDYEADLFTVLADYREVVLQHGRWLATGDGAARAAWDDARARFDASRSAHVERYGDDLYLPAYTFTAADLGLERAGRDLPAAWAARALGLLLVVALLLGTAPGQRLLARLGRRRASGGRGPAGPVAGGLALRALWLGATRPWRVAAAVTGAGRADRVVLLVLPVVAVVLSRVVYTWALSWVHLALVLGAWVLFVGVLRLVAGRRGSLALAGAVGGAAVLRTVLLLGALVPTGPGGYWYGLWAEPGPRTAYVTLATAAFGWVLVAAWFALRSLGAGVLAATGRVLVAVASPLVVGGAVVAWVGLEPTLTAWNDQMMVLPWGLSRILGLTVHLGIPADLPVLVAAAGLVVGGVGALAWRLGRRVPDAA